MNAYVTRLARKFPRVQHTQLRKTEHETLSILIQIKEIKMNKKKNKLSPVNHSNKQRLLNTKTAAKNQKKEIKITSSLATSEEVMDATGPGLGPGRKSSTRTLPSEGPGSEGAPARPSPTASTNPLPAATTTGDVTRSVVSSFSMLAM
jgi:hypothetical protein